MDQKEPIKLKNIKWEISTPSPSPSPTEYLKIKQGKVTWKVQKVKEEFDIFYITSLIIYRSYRRKGYGTKLMQLLFDYASKQGIYCIELDNGLNPSNDFYAKLGFCYRHNNKSTPDPQSTDTTMYIQIK